MKITKFIPLIFIVVDVLLFIYLLVHGKNVQLLNPAGVIAAGEQNLMVTMLTIMLIVGIPVILILFFVAWKYRDTNSHAKYNPDAATPKFLTFVGWGIPAIVVVILAVMTWKATFALDPYKPIPGSNAITIQVVALRWKWLFIYPAQDIATVNYVEFPVGTPVNFQLTADAPMNSFWIPQLSGQIYAMTGMSTPLHVEASKIGEYAGSAAEISGEGFATMRFTTHVVSSSDFNSWVSQVQQTSKQLDLATYNKLAAPSVSNPPAFYSSVEKDLFNSIIVKYMGPGASSNMKIMEQGYQVQKK